MLFEIIIIGVILLALSYWAVLWLMGRREDVLHGEFVQGRAQQANAQAEEPARPIFPQPQATSVFPKKPVLPEKRVSAEKPLAAAKPVQTDITKPVRAAVPEQPAFRPERLESLLNSIKQDLNQLVQK